MAIDGKPATQGMPLEAELRYYYNYYFAHRSVTFGAFLSALSRDLSRMFPDLDLTLDWARECDRTSRVGAARTAMQKLRACVGQGTDFRISFWDMLWDLTEVSVKTFGIGLREIGTNAAELVSLTCRYFLKECRDRVQTLKNLGNQPDSPAAQEAFRVVDGILNGVPIPPDEFCKNSRSHHSTGCGYEMYRKVAEGTAVPPRKIGWSAVEHQACRARVFPDSEPEPAPVVITIDPTAPATNEQIKRVTEDSMPPERLAARVPETVIKRRKRSPYLPASWASRIRRTLFPFLAPFTLRAALCDFGPG